MRCIRACHETVSQSATVSSSRKFRRGVFSDQSLAVCHWLLRHHLHRLVQCQSSKNIISDMFDNEYLCKILVRRCSGQFLPTAFENASSQACYVDSIAWSRAFGALCGYSTEEPALQLYVHIRRIKKRANTVHVRNRMPTT